MTHLLVIIGQKYEGRKRLPERQQKLYRFMHSLKKIAYHYGIAVVVTNHVHDIPNRYAVSDTSDSKESVGGTVMGHNITYGISLKRQYEIRSLQRILSYRARIVFSPYHPQMDAHFYITDKGVVDLPSQKLVKPK